MAVSEVGHCITIAKAAYYFDVKGLGPLVTPFDDIPLRTKLHYFNLAEFVMRELELLA